MSSSIHLRPIPETLKGRVFFDDNPNRLKLWDGRLLDFHRPIVRKAIDPKAKIFLGDLVPTEWKNASLEIEIGSGKGEMIAKRAALHPKTFFIGIDKRKDRFVSTEKKLNRIDSEIKNWKLVNEDARRFLEAGLPTRINVLHVYHPDPWPKKRHHKHRFFRSPDALAWSLSICSGGELRISSDHYEYFEEILDIVASWKLFATPLVFKKEWYHIGSLNEASTHFEKIFLAKKEPVYKAFFKKL